MGRIMSTRHDDRTQRPQRPQRNTLLGKTVDHSFDAVPQPLDVEIHEESQLALREFQMRAELCAVDLLEPFDCFDFNDQFVVHEEIDPITAIQSSSSIDERQRHLRSLYVRGHVRWKREAVRFRKPSQLATSSSTESPPNFSTTASARTNATIASPTTAAAGTAQTSLRSTVAGLSVIVARSTERSGFISVEIGFMYAVTRRSSPLVTPPSRPPALLVGRLIGIGSSRPRSVSGRISSCTREPGTSATPGPRPMPTPLMAGNHHHARARPAVTLRFPPPS